MIRPFARHGHGLAQRSFTHAHTRPVSIALGLGPYARQWPTSSIQARWLSDGPRADVEKPAKDAPPLPPNAPRKPKVALHPAPIRPAPTKPPPAPTIAKDMEVKEEAAVEGKESIMDMARRDLQVAQEHGVLVPPPETAGRVGRLWHQAKELFKFYMRGMKLVYTNRKASSEIQARVKSGGDPLTRWEARFIERTNSDVIKVIPFILIVLIIEEIIPLIVLYAPWMLPSTCLLPSQRERIETKRREKQAAAARAMSPDLRQLLERPTQSLTQNDRTELVAVLSVLSLSTLGPPPTRLKRIEKHLKRITEDDTRLAAEGFGSRLNLVELGEALEERGIPNVGLKPEEAAKRLEWWLREATVAGSEQSDAVSRRVALVARSGLGQF
ncbi:hypothetical protein PENSPDRAFT_657109 [Peniophora sp. CONT]|nr:hypothetical protein PENSPDRAFT_657109 [Peniophora sp. CONT]